MEKERKPNGYWTFDKCKEEASKYTTRTIFQKNSTIAYRSSVKNGWLNECCSHMIVKKKPNGYYTKERCKEEALKYKNKKTFSEKSKGAYNASYKKKWIDEICSHMKPQGSRYKRCIYVYEFSDNHAYVGLTYDIEKRHKQHIEDTNSYVYKHKLKTGLEPTIKQLTEYIDKEEASKLEGVYKQQYINNGWNILNKAKTGGLGGNNLMWTKETCHEEALKYNSRKDFKINSNGAYESARKHGWLDEICLDMIETKKQSNYWCYKNCKIEALKYNKKTNFNLYSRGAYESARKNKWLDEICSHM
jgi:predicted GIY-YIG superfamily endonuclease